MTSKVFIIAEAGVNHNGDIGRARELVHVAKEAGADAVKFQIFEPGLLVTRQATTASYQKKNTGDSAQSQFDMLSALTLSQAEYATLQEESHKVGIQFLATPFDEQSLAFLLTLGIDKIKIGSGDITHGLLLLQAGRSKKPVIVSTGMSDYNDIHTALSTIAFGQNTAEGYPEKGSKHQKPHSVSLLHCVSQYPAPMAAMNLRVIPKMAADFSLPIGLSDHTIGITASFAAVSLGATIIEKHFTLDKNLPGPDHKASLDPTELKAMVSGIREIELALGSDVKRCVNDELDVRNVARRSLVASCVVKRGEPFSEQNITAKRPATGTPPEAPWNLYGQTASRDYQPDDPIDEKI